MSAPEPTDAALLVAWTEGDRRAFEALVRRHGQDVKAYAARVLRDVVLAEDVYVETFARAAAAARTYDGRGSVRGWLFRIAHHAALDLIRTDRRGRALEERWAAETSGDVAPGPEAVVLLGELARTLEDAIGRLPVQHREVVVLRLVHGLAGDEVAAVLGVEEEQVRSMLSYARKVLRKTVEREPAVGRAG